MRRTTTVHGWLALLRCVDVRSRARPVAEFLVVDHSLRLQVILAQRRRPESGVDQSLGTPPWRTTGVSR